MEVMWGEVGIAYVYRSYGIHVMLNVVAKPTRATGAVLIRAVQPLEGIEIMQSRRGVVDERLLCSGPGKLCQALGISLEMHGTDLVGGEALWISLGEPAQEVSTSGRIGISRATEHPWRYWVTGNPFVSAHRRALSTSE